MQQTTTVQAQAGSVVSSDNLLQLVQQVAEEVQQHKAVPRAALDSALDRDLGLDSLARMELIGRIEKHFGIALPERVFAEAETPRDLLRALFTVTGARGQRTSVETSEVQLSWIEPAPQTATTLIDVLHWHATHHPDRPHVQLYADEGEGEQITYRRLWESATAVAAGLQQQGLQTGDSVALMLLTGPDYFFSFYGVLMAGGVPVPIYPPFRPSQIEDHLRRHQGILNNCRVVCLITFAEVKPIARLLQAHVTSLRHIVTTHELMVRDSELEKPVVSAQDIAFLQYTSGSTGNPKGVILTHANLLTNIRAMGEHLEANAEDVFVSWLPLYHDMGLIGAWLGSLYYSALFVAMSPMAFLARPQRWLWAIHRYRGTLSAAPNFGYELCLRRLDRQETASMDLSSWRAAFNGAEAVSPATAEEFCQRFSPNGFDRHAMMPVYGLAENTVGLAFPPLKRGPWIDAVQRKTLATERRALTADPGDTSALRFISCGLPLANHEVRVVDAADRELPERQEGRLQFRGPSATTGYLRNPEETQRLFHGDWLESGDLAYIANGEIFITGRSKGIIIRAGRNLYPDEIEHVVGELPAIRAGRVAVFGSPDPQSGTERLVVLAETRETEAQVLEGLHAEINACVTRLIESPPEKIVLAPPGTVLKTSSGKIRRSACRTLFEENRIGARPSPPWLQFLRMALLGLQPKLRQMRLSLSARLYAVYAWIVFWLLAPTAWALVVLLPPIAWRWQVMRVSTRLLCRACACPMTVTGKEHLLPPDQPCVYVSNHASYLDGPLLITALERRFSFVAKAELDKSFIPGIFLRRIQSEFVERLEKQRGIKDAQRLAALTKQGRSLFYFPEGTFSRMPGLLPFHMGGFIAAVEADVPVVPIILRGTRSILRSDTWMPRRGTINIAIAEPIRPEMIRHKDGSVDTWAGAVNLRNKVREKILDYYDEPDLARARSL